MLKFDTTTTLRGLRESRVDQYEQMKDDDLRSVVDLIKSYCTVCFVFVTFKRDPKGGGTRRRRRTLVGNREALQSSG